jgi:hypothetical protein
MAQPIPDGSGILLGNPQIGQAHMDTGVIRADNHREALICHRHLRV